MDLGTSPWEVIDQIEEVERHQKEGEHEKETEYHTWCSDHNIHFDCFGCFWLSAGILKLMIVALRSDLKVMEPVADNKIPTCSNV